MCGIVGILGTHETAPALVEGLRRLEYRGYDSAGIATVDNGRLDRRRAAGKLDSLSDLLVHNPLTGKSGIGHTRWATHGGPSTENAHPHMSGRVAVVHNGIIENFKPLRDDLEKSGYAAETETDTETIALLTARHIDAGMSEIDAVRATLAQLEGAFALAFLFEGQDDLMIGARRGSPLAVGWGDGEMFLGSDAIALAPLTDRVTYLDEGDMVVLTRTSAEIFDAAGHLANRPVRQIETDSTRVEKGGYKHFMAKEIAEQPRVFAGLLEAYIHDDALRFPAEVPDFKDIDRIIIVACGTAYYAGLTAKYWFEQVARIPVEVDVASEFRYREPPIGARTLAIFVSQSGETADTLAALRYCTDKATTVAVVNVPESSIARESDIVLPIYAGAEIGVASTKAFTCQLGVLSMLALRAAQDRGEITADSTQTALTALASLPGLMSQVLHREDAIDAVSH
ncbi:MAG: glutamine--fructose-6-phosphate transaminase (isomerizing), partial [Rhodobacteraceae bacterium]|nr:glutamine--fructose-6-phosphate transaminase (isomerizing) [Paracoccaceae bacterium]